MTSQANKIARLRNRWIMAQHKIQLCEEWVLSRAANLEWARKYHETDLLMQVVTINELEDAMCDLVHARNRLTYMEEEYTKFSPHVRRQVMK